MSEGRTPTATLTEQRRLEQEDVDILHQIVVRAQNDLQSHTNPKDALLQSYGEIFNERRLSQHQDRACFNVLLKLLDPSVPGESLYHRFEAILRGEGIVLDYEDDTNASESEHEVNGTASQHLTGKDITPKQLSTPLDQFDEDQALPTSAQSPQIPVNRLVPPFQSQINRDPIEPAGEDIYLDTPPTYVNTLLEVAIRKDQRALIKQTFEAFQRALEIGRTHREEELANSFYEARLKRKTLKQYLAVSQDLQTAQIQADQIYFRRLAHDALTKITDEHRVRRLDSIDQDRVKGLSLYKWTLASRESYFIRKRDWSTRRNILWKLVTSYRTGQLRQEQLNHLLQHSHLRNRNNLLRSALNFLVRTNNTIQEEETKADNANKKVLYTAAINVWRMKTGKLTDLALTGEDAREYFLMMRVLRRLRSLTQFRRERKNWLATWTLRRWREYVKSCKHERYDEAYRQMRRTLKINLAKRLLHHWQGKANRLRMQSSQADKLYHSSILQRFAKPLVEMTWDTADWSSKSGIIADQKAMQFLEQRALIALQQKRLYLEGMNDRSDRLRQYRLEQRAVQGLRQMHLKAFELRRRQLDADAFMDRHDKRGVRNILSKMRRVLAEQQSGEEGPLILQPAPAVTPAKKREELLFNSSTRLSTTPAYTPFSARLRSEPRILSDIEDVEELDSAHEHDLVVEDDLGG